MRMLTDVPIAFLMIAAVTLVSAVCAMSLRNLVHCGLCLVLTFVGLAAAYLHLNAEFVGFAQVLVYVGAVAILIVFTILLTRNVEVTLTPVSRSWLMGLGIAIAVCASLVLPLVMSPSLRRLPALPSAPDAKVQLIGEKLMAQYVIPLEALALVLTAAMIGAVVIAMRDEPERTSIETNSMSPKAAGSGSDTPAETGRNTSPSSTTPRP